MERVQVTGCHEHERQRFDFLHLSEGETRGGSEEQAMRDIDECVSIGIADAL